VEPAGAVVGAALIVSPAKEVAGANISSIAAAYPIYPVNLTMALPLII
jgi:hypothetical protein